ncbi:hypothetical protein D9M68_741490 [compost metagenome]
MDRQNSAAALVLKLLVVTAVVNADALDALHAGDVIDVELTQLFQPSPGEPSKKWEPVSPRMVTCLLR